MASITYLNCTLEVDRERGVLYVHSSKGITLVRICQIPQVLLDRERAMIDVVFDRELAKGMVK